GVLTSLVRSLGLAGKLLVQGEAQVVLRLLVLVVAIRSLRVYRRIQHVSSSCPSGTHARTIRTIRTTRTTRTTRRRRLTSGRPSSQASALSRCPRERLLAQVGAVRAGHHVVQRLDEHERHDAAQVGEEVL